MTERLHFQFSLSCIGEGNGNPLQCSCLENPRDGGAWWAAVSGVTQSRTRLKWLCSSSSSNKIEENMKSIFKFRIGTSLALQRLRLCASNAVGVGSIAGGELGSHMPCDVAKKTQKKTKTRVRRDQSWANLLPGQDCRVGHFQLFSDPASDS